MSKQSKTIQQNPLFCSVALQSGSAELNWRENPGHYWETTLPTSLKPACENREKSMFDTTRVEVLVFWGRCYYPELELKSSDDLKTSLPFPEAVHFLFNFSFLFFFTCCIFFLLFSIFLCIIFHILLLMFFHILFLHIPSCFLFICMFVLE